MNRVLRVDLHDEVVGHLTESADGVRFNFDGGYLARSPRPVLGQCFEDDLGRTYRSRRGQHLPDFFANLIPEGRLREVIEQRTGIDPGDDLGLLLFVGNDLPGAAKVRSADDESGSPPDEHEPRFDKGSEPKIDADQLRFSVAGVQLKFSMLRQDEKLTLPAQSGNGDWIVKLASPVYSGLCENEYSMLTWAREAGFEVPEIHLHPSSHLAENVRALAPKGSSVLAIRRYDRTPDGPLHQEDFAQAVGLPPSLKYEHITFDVMARLVRGFIGELGVVELVKRLVLMVACGNNDAHLKNWALIYPDRIQAQWSPVYDQVATVAWPDPDRKLALKLGSVKDFGRIDRAAFERFGERAEIEHDFLCKIVDETLGSLRDTWDQIEGDLPLAETHRSTLLEHWQRVPLLEPLRR